MKSKLVYIILSMALLAACMPACAPRRPVVTTAIPSTPLQNESDLSPLLKEIGKAKIVLIGDASHGTEEFYKWRIALTKRLIREKGFKVITVEGDWKDCYDLNNYIKQPATDTNALKKYMNNFSRFPAWLWKNEETAEFMKWLRNNAQGVSFYGLDIFSISETLSALMENNDSLVRTAARDALTCFKFFSQDESSYALPSTNVNCSGTCSRLEKSFKPRNNNENDFVTTQLIRSAVDGEKYYRVSRTDRAASWNIRDRHMLTTLNNIISRHGRNSKIIVWVHNTHTGNAHYSEMLSTGQTTLGEILKQQFGKSVYLVGTATYEGTVLASRSWGGKMEVMKVPPAKEGSVESILHQNSSKDRIIFSKNIVNHPLLKTWRDQRAIGAVYRNEREIFVPSVIPGRYDALIFIDHSHALHPL
jgi:erythromycin esterase